MTTLLLEPPVRVSPWSDAMPVHACGVSGGASSGAGTPESLAGELSAILAEGRLKPHFQPILDLGTGKVHGFEGLVRGPSDSVLHSPLNLLQVAARGGRLLETEIACCRTLVQAFAASGQPHRLFLNLSPGSLFEAETGTRHQLAVLAALGLPPGRIVIELTESQPTFDFKSLARTADHYRRLGFAIAMDDLGEGFSSLRLWSELRPEYVKIDLHFIQGVAQDPVKLQFLRSIRDIAGKTGSRIVAEGIELESDLAVIQDLGLDFGQGYLFGRPQPNPQPVPAPILLRAPAEPALAGQAWIRASRTTAARLLQEIAPVAPETPNGAVEQRFIRERELQSVPVVKDGIPVGLINRNVFIDLMGRPFARELYAKRPCSTQMDACILVVDQGTALHELSRLIVESDPRHILHGFILTRNGAYAGMGSGHDLMREITRMQINAARYANPLTGLPGNVPINEHLDDLLRQEIPFVACYFDLDHFKPFNDVHGYRRGDEVLHWLGNLLRAHSDPDLDFVGHIGGDDFMLVFRSPDWERRCLDLLATFERDRGRFFGAEALALGGYESEDRQGRVVLHPLLGLSVGAVRAPAGAFPTHHEIAAAAALAKREAKRQPGSSLFVERRNLVPGK
jgi:EAL domain-containing protein (putative c-di-GMP-specific phosphodiesterase class I)/GGDEF domain-containing protein